MSCFDCAADLVSKAKRCKDCTKLYNKKYRAKYHEVHKPKMTQKVCCECNTLFDLQMRKQRLCPTCCMNKQRARCKLYKSDNKAHISEYNKHWKLQNTPAITLYNNTYNKHRKKHDSMFRLKTNHRSLISTVLNKGYTKQSKSRDLLGCTWEFLVDWLKHQFTEGMTMDNYGSVWHIDHCIPCSWFDLSIIQEQFICFNWSNLQPMYAERNLSKGNTTNLWEQVLQELKIKVFLTHTTHPHKNFNIIQYDKYDYFY